MVVLAAWLLPAERLSRPGLVGHIIGFVVYFTLLDRFGPLEVNLVTYLNPVVAVIVGWLLLGEPVLPSALVGFGVILFGFVLLREKELAAELATFRGAGR